MSAAAARSPQRLGPNREYRVVVAVRAREGLCDHCRLRILPGQEYRYVINARASVHTLCFDAWAEERR